MNLHQLFLADLGPELQLTAETLRQASFAVRRNRNEWLLRQRTRAVIEMIAHTADQWLEPENQFRILALRDAPQETGWSFDAATNELSFDADVYPGEGAEVRVDYVMAESCP